MIDVLTQCFLQGLRMFFCTGPQEVLHVQRPPELKVNNCLSGDGKSIMRDMWTYFPVSIAGVCWFCADFVYCKCACLSLCFAQSLPATAALIVSSNRGTAG